MSLIIRKKDEYCIPAIQKYPKVAGIRMFMQHIEKQQ